MSQAIERANAGERKPERDFRILVVEDDQGVRGMLHVFLSNEGWTVDTASNGEEGLERIRNSDRPYDVVVTDWKMPKKGGLEMTSEAQKDFPQTRFILMSGDLDPEVYGEGWWIGNGFQLAIAKPFHPSKMVEPIRKLFQDKIDMADGHLVNKD